MICCFPSSVLMRTTIDTTVKSTGSPLYPALHSWGLYLPRRDRVSAFFSCPSYLLLRPVQSRGAQLQSRGGDPSYSSPNSEWHTENTGFQGPSPGLFIKQRSHARGGKLNQEGQRLQLLPPHPQPLLKLQSLMEKYSSSPLPAPGARLRGFAQGESQALKKKELPNLFSK